MSVTPKNVHVILNHQCQKLGRRQTNEENFYDQGCWKQGAEGRGQLSPPLSLKNYPKLLKDMGFSLKFMSIPPPSYASSNTPDGNM